MTDQPELFTTNYAPITGRITFGPAVETTMSPAKKAGAETLRCIGAGDKAQSKAAGPMCPETARPPERRITAHSQAQVILAYLKGGHSLTHLECERLFDCLRLGARAWDINRNKGGCNPDGLIVKSKMITTESGKRVAEYSL